MCHTSTHPPVLTLQMSSALHNYTTQSSPVLYHYPLQLSSALNNYHTTFSMQCIIIPHNLLLCFIITIVVVFLQSLNQKWDLDKVTSLLQNDRNCFVQHKLCSAKEISYLENKFRSKSISLEQPFNSHMFLITCMVDHEQESLCVKGVYIKFKFNTNGTSHHHNSETL